MDFGKKKIIRTFVKKVAQNFASVFACEAAKNETRREKRAKSVFRAKTKAIEESKIAAKNFPSFCENHPIFWVRNSAY